MKAPKSPMSWFSPYGAFDQATSRHAIDVLRAAMEAHGKPASILTDRGSQFYANEGQYKKKGASEFERELVSLGIRQILARVRHPQTSGKLERVHGELQRKLHLFEEESGRQNGAFSRIRDGPCGRTVQHETKDGSRGAVCGMVQPRPATHVT